MDFTIVVTVDCSVETVTLPSITVSDVTYRVRESAIVYTFPEFTSSHVDCLLSYSLIVLTTGLTKTDVNVARSDRTVTYYGTDNTNAE